MYFSIRESIELTLHLSGYICIAHVCHFDSFLLKAPLYCLLILKEYVVAPSHCKGNISDIFCLLLIAHDRSLDQNHRLNRKPA